MQSDKCLFTTPNLITDYKPQGHAEKIAGLDCYVVHRESPVIGIISIYDAFGATVPGHLGVDLLASHLPAVVIEPDILEGDVSQPEWYPITDATKEKAEAWREKLFSQPWTVHTDRIKEVVKEAKAKYGVERWGIMGFCLGGKIAAMISDAGTPFKAAVAVHPGGLNIKEAEALTIPYRLMASQDEPAEVVAEHEAYFKKHPEKQCESETYPQPHGWAAARAKLDDPEGKKEFERAHNDIAEFFKKHV